MSATKIRAALEDLRGKRRHSFADFDALLKRCLREYGYLFPNYLETRHGSKLVCHFNVGDLAPISLEKEHGSREFVPFRYAKFALAGLDDLISYIEAHGETKSPTAEDET